MYTQVSFQAIKPLIGYDVVPKIEGIIQSDDGIVLRHSTLKFHIIYQPEGAGCATGSTTRECIYKKTSVVQITNDDNNYFWYAFTVSMNKDCKDMKSNARPNRRNAYGAKTVSQS